VSSFQLYVADAIDLMRSLPDESIDLIVTDTAYESLEKHRAKGTTTRLKVSAGSSNEWFPIFGNERFAEFFAESFRVLKKDAHLYFYCDPETAFIAKPEGEKAGFKFWKPIVWAKTKQGTAPDADDLVVEHQAIGMGYHLRASYEFILFFEKGKRKISDLGVRDLLPFPTVRNKYPTQKPVELNRVFVRLSSEPGETVLDPFMGSGSTGIAAVRNGRHFIGGDIKHAAVADVEKVLKSEGAVSGGDTIVIPLSTERPVRPEPPPKKTRAKKADVMPIAEVDGGDMALNAERRGHSHDHRCSCAMCERERRVPRAFEIKVSDAPLPPPPAVSFIEQLEAAFAIPADPDCSLDLLERTPPTNAPPTKTVHRFAPRPDSRYCAQCPCEEYDPIHSSSAPELQLDGQFMTGPLPGGPTRHLPRPNLIPPPRPATCQHGDARSACILCRARR
jgi:site-specific DNA-methyltransferase (adenine-specific)